MPIKNLSLQYEDLPAGVAQRREALLEALAEDLFQIRNERLARIERYLTDASARAELGTIHAKPYEGVAQLGVDAVEPSVCLCRTAIDNYIQHLLAMLGNTGSDVRVGKNHAIRYKLIAEVIDERTHEVVEHSVINRDTERALMQYFGQWLNRYGSASNSK